MQSGRVSTDVLLGKSQKNDRVHPALGSHPCPGFAECYRERARMLQGVIPVAAPGRINRGHLGTAWDSGESLPREGCGEPQDCLPQAGRCYSLGPSSCYQPRMKSSSAGQGGVGHNNQLLSLPTAKEMQTRRCSGERHSRAGKEVGKGGCRKALSLGMAEETKR